MGQVQRENNSRDALIKGINWVLAQRRLGIKNKKKIDAGIAVQGLPQMYAHTYVKWN